MATSPLLGIDRAQPTARGHDTEDLGPSDTTDSGSDVAGLGDLNEGDPNLPVDVAAEGDRQHTDSVADAFGPGADSDHTGTGERRGAVSDTGGRDAADIGPDRIVSDPNGLSAGDGEHDDLLADGDDEAQEELPLAAADEGDEDDDESSGRPSP